MFDNNEGLLQYSSYLTDTNLNYNLLYDYNVNTQNEDDNSLKIANTSYVDRTFKSTLEKNFKKKYSGQKNIIYDKNDKNIIKICEFGPNNLFSICLNSSNMETPWINTTCNTNDNLVINFSSSLNYLINNVYTIYGQNFSKKISKYGTSDISSCDLTKTNMCNFRFNEKSWSIESILNDSKNDTLYIINLTLLDVNNIFYSYLYMIEQLI